MKRRERINTNEMRGLGCQMAVTISRWGTAEPLPLQQKAGRGGRFFNRIPGRAHFGLPKDSILKEE